MSLALKTNTHSYCPLNPFVSIILLRVQLRDAGLIISLILTMTWVMNVI